MTVSVVVTAYNRGPLIAPTLNSVLDQTQPPLEIVVVDDGSTDGTPDWIEANYGDEVRVIRRKNGGVARARNTGWRNAKGEWIAFLDHDDLFRRDKLETLEPYLDGQVGVVVSRWREVKNGEPVFIPPVVHPRSAFSWLFGWNNPIVSVSVPLVRRTLIERIGGFLPHTAPADDWSLWLRLARVAQFAFCDEVLTDYSLHDNQQRLDEARMFRAVRHTLGRFPLELAKRPLLLWWLLWSGAFVPSIPAYNAFRSGKRGALQAALAHHPLSVLAPQWLALGAKQLRRTAMERYLKR